MLRAGAWYYIVTGIWPIVNRRSFEAVTGSKVDFWLVRTVGVTVSAIGTGLALAAQRDQLSREMQATALVAAAGLAAIDVVYVARRRIRPVYLLDAVAQAVFLRALAHRDRTLSALAPATHVHEPNPTGRARR
jgi:hypothetical protein